MAYDVNKLTKLGALKEMGQRLHGEVETLSGKVETLEKVGAQANVIEKIKVNGTEQAVTDKAVDITVPTKVSDLDNDSKFQTDTEVAAAIAAADHMKRKIVDSTSDIDLAAEDASQYIYMVKKSSTKTGDKYDEYMVLDGALEKVGDWEVDLSNYQTKEDGKGLSTNDYTNEDKAKLGGVAEGATKVEASTTNGNVKVNGVETQVYKEPADVVHGEVASDEEVTAMLTEIFGK